MVNTARPEGSTFVDKLRVDQIGKIRGLLRLLLATIGRSSCVYLLIGYICSHGAYYVDYSIDIIDRRNLKSRDRNSYI